MSDHPRENFLQRVKAARPRAACAAGPGPGRRPAAEAFRSAHGVGGSSPPAGARHEGAAAPAGVSTTTCSPVGIGRIALRPSRSTLITVPP
jgi:hypothetical protein